MKITCPIFVGRKGFLIISYLKTKCIKSCAVDNEKNLLSVFPLSYVLQILARIEPF